MFLDGIPKLAESLLVRIAVLHDEPLNAFRMPQREPVTNRGAVVHDVHRVFGESERLNKTIDDVREVFKGVREGLVIRHAALAEARIIGSHQAKGAGEARNQVPEHVRRSRETVQEQDRGRCLGTGFAVEDVQVVHANGLVMHRILRAHVRFGCNHRVLLGYGAAG